MPSKTAKQAAGTFIADSAPNLPATLAWITNECRQGCLSGYVKRFCEFQQEILDTDLVLVESLHNNELICRIPCKVSDYESPSTFDLVVSFKMDPQTGNCRRI